MPVDIEIYEPGTREERGHPDWTPIKPYRIKINGTEVLTPDGAPVIIEGLVDKFGCATATVKMFIRSLKVHGGED